MILMAYGHSFETHRSLLHSYEHQTVTHPVLLLGRRNKLCEFSAFRNTTQKVEL